MKVISAKYKMKGTLSNGILQRKGILVLLGVGEQLVGREKTGLGGEHIPPGGNSWSQGAERGQRLK